MTQALSEEELGPERVQILKDVLAQLDAFQAAAMASKASQATATSKWPDLAHRRQVERSPQVITFSGKRGVGKTSMVLTLVEGWHVVKEEKGRENEHKWLADHAGVVRNSLVLPGVDFDPHPIGLSAYAQLVGALEPLAKAVSDPRACSADGSLLERWQGLMGRALAGWDGASAQLKHDNLDDWSFAAQQAHSAWRLLQATFVELLDDLLKAAQEKGYVGAGGLLLLPIDDVDMRVRCVRDLLLALRQLHHPRLV